MKLPSYTIILWKYKRTNGIDWRVSHGDGRMIEWMENVGGADNPGPMGFMWHLCDSKEQLRCKLYDPMTRLIFKRRREAAREV